MSTIMCTGCGMPIPAGKAFCTNCGTRAPGATDPGVSDPTRPTPVTQPSPTQPHEQARPTPAYPSTQPIPAYETTGGRSQWRTIGIAALLAIIVGAVAAFMWPASAGEVVADATVGPAGGTIPFSDGGEMRIPEGAVKTPQKFTVRKTTTREPARIGGMTYPAGSLPLYLFSPATISFGDAVVVILPLPPGAVAGRIYVISGGRLTLIAVRPAEDGTVRISVIGFSGGRLVVRT